MAIPGSVVAAGKLVTPGGAAGPLGGTGPAGPTVVSADAGNIAVLGSDNLILVPQSTIWSQRLRSYNSVGCPNFEVDQQNCGAARSNVPLGGRMVDRWLWGRSGSHQINSQQWPFLVNLPGTNFMVSQSPLTVVIATAQATLAAGDSGYMYQTVEGPMLRELLSDVHSVSILIRSTTANVKFSYFIQDATSAHSYTKLCTIPVANTWTLITIPNIPVFTASATWNIKPGNIGCVEGLTFGVGSTYVSSTDGAWVNAGVLASPGTTNWFANATGNEIDIAFVQHEPGSLCTTLMDKPFTQNLDECLRYYIKSAPYGVMPNAAQSMGNLYIYSAATTNQFFGTAIFRKVMAKTPTVTLYSPVTGAANTVRNLNTNADLTVTSILNQGDSSFCGYALSAAPLVSHNLAANWSADTGW